jgi:hypothetical protein
MNLGLFALLLFILYWAEQEAFQKRYFWRSTALLRVHHSEVKRARGSYRFTHIHRLSADYKGQSPVSPGKSSRGPDSELISSRAYVKPKSPSSSAFGRRRVGALQEQYARNEAFLRSLKVPEHSIQMILADSRILRPRDRPEPIDLKTRAEELRNSTGATFGSCLVSLCLCIFSSFLLLVRTVSATSSQSPSLHSLPLPLAQERPVHSCVDICTVILS